MRCVLGIIPARGGSKGIPNKNIAVVGGLPLIGWSIKAAQNCESLSHIVLSTDDSKIADVGSSLGLPVEALRPAHLATDSSPTLDVIRYEVGQYETRHGARVDDIVLLQPTAPCRTAADISEAYISYCASGKESLISLYEATHVHPRIMYRRTPSGLASFLGDVPNVRRQEMEAVYVRNGAIYIASRHLIMDRNMIVGESPAEYIMPREKSLNIDEPFDLRMAELLLSRTAQ